ncbi:hypothetical protein PMAYCL1PPCAC_20401, partial [Pristionchus mayeri]
DEMKLEYSRPASYGSYMRSRFSTPLSPQFKMDGLDRVKLLTQLVSPAFDTLDRMIPKTSSSD